MQIDDLPEACKQAVELLKTLPDFKPDEIVETNAYLHESAQRILVDGVRQAIDNRPPGKKLRIV